MTTLTMKDGRDAAKRHKERIPGELTAGIAPHFGRIGNR